MPVPHSKCREHEHDEAPVQGETLHSGILRIPDHRPVEADRVAFTLRFRSATACLNSSSLNVYQLRCANDMSSLDRCPKPTQFLGSGFHLFAPELSCQEIT